MSLFMDVRNSRWALPAALAATLAVGVATATTAHADGDPAQVQGLVNSAHATAVPHDHGPAGGNQHTTPTQGRPPVVLGPVDETRVLRLAINAHAASMHSQLADLRGSRFNGSAHAAAVWRQLADLAR
jgi:hypothetical protein